MTPLLEVSNLSTEIELSHSVIHAVGDISFSLNRGEMLGLVGESGCGKSITGLSIMGLLPAGGRITGGSVRLDGRELVGLDDGSMRRIRGDEIAMVFQDSSSALNPTKTIAWQLAEALLLHREVSKKEAFERAVEALASVGVPHPRQRMSDYPHQLSGGLRQRVMIAMALACEPQVLIADEPTTALDVTIQAQILQLLDRLRAERGMAVLLVTHDMGVVAGRADRVNVMYAGRFVESSTTRELFAQTKHPYTQALLASIPTLERNNRRPLFSIAGLPPDLRNPPVGCRFAPRCPYAQEDCRAKEPAFTGGKGHRFACWHPVDGPLPVEKDDDAGVMLSVTYQAEAVLAVRDVIREYPVGAGALARRNRATVKAVSEVSLTVRPGEIFGLVGESGCGKTTLGKLIVGIERPDGGTISLDNENVARLGGADLRRRRRDLQMMFQDPYGSLDPRMRVGAIVREPLAAQRVGTRKEQEARVAELLEEVGLPPDAAVRFPHEFSGGQRQRVGLARALALSPRLIVADEPVSALDVSIRSQVLNLIKRLQAERDMAWVVISHDLAVVKYLADRIGVMYLGKLVEVADGSELYARPAHPYTAGLMQAIPIPDPDAERRKSNPGVSGELPSPIDPPSGCRFRTRCPRAQQRCADEEPPLRAFGAGHVAACHFPLIPADDGATLAPPAGTPA